MNPISGEVDYHGRGRGGYSSNTIASDNRNIQQQQPQHLLSLIQTASSDLSNQSCTHGLSILRGLRSGGSVDPHVYRDWLIFEERLKQNHRRLRRKKRRYLTQIFVLIIMTLVLSWGSLFASVKFLDQCNRVLHQYNMRLEPFPNALDQQTPVSADISSPETFRSTPAAATRDTYSQQTKSPQDAGSNFSFGSKRDTQLLFFPSIPRSLISGYSDFKKTYYRKREASKRKQSVSQRQRSRSRSLQDGAKPSKKAQDGQSNSIVEDTSVMTPTSASAITLQRRWPTTAGAESQDSTPAVIQRGSKQGRPENKRISFISDTETEESITDLEFTPVSSQRPNSPLGENRESSSGSYLYGDRKPGSPSALNWKEE
ncbi:hypothetical protein H4219_001591 [Mycoemilia scoparia]|uniref:Transmembrane protein 188 n=1 Tax=Mycoemilia scoparia TaxID=417184 RepID=A0A9W8A4H3_9FUNG|nr:hypothetical protein H4219_001591 [Mycoemilia scoparia]